VTVAVAVGVPIKLSADDAVAVFTMPTPLKTGRLTVTVMERGALFTRFFNVQLTALAVTVQLSPVCGPTTEAFTPVVVVAGLRDAKVPYKLVGIGSEITSVGMNAPPVKPLAVAVTV
jgi:hypothetical protein